MRYQAMWAGLLVSGVAIGQTVTPAPSRPARAYRGGDDAQVFIAPSGEPFRGAEGVAYPTAAWFAGADRNHDGRIDAGEFATDFMRYFDVLDTDHDGMLSPAEISRYETDLAPEVQSYEGGGGFGGGGHGGLGAGAGGHHGGHHGGEGGGRGGMGGGGDEGGGGDASSESSAAVGQSSEIEHDLSGDRPSGGGRFGLINIPEPVASMDTSFSGHVSRADAMAAAQRRFALLDPDGKGSIAWADLPQTWAQQRMAKRAARAAKRR
jgi:hypothetical protein